MGFVPLLLRLVLVSEKVNERRGGKMFEIKLSGIREFMVALARMEKLIEDVPVLSCHLSGEIRTIQERRTVGEEKVIGLLPAALFEVPQLPVSVEVFVVMKSVPPSPDVFWVGIKLSDGTHWWVEVLDWERVGKIVSGFEQSIEESTAQAQQLNSADFCSLLASDAGSDEDSDEDSDPLYLVTLTGRSINSQGTG